MSARSVAAIRSLDRRFAGENGDGLWVACSHGDVIKSVIADAMGMHLDSFQRIVVDTASITVIRYGSTARTSTPSTTPQRCRSRHLGHPGPTTRMMRWWVARRAPT